MNDEARATIRQALLRSCRALGFATSAIKSGESWSDTCEVMFADALRQASDAVTTLDVAGLVSKGRESPTDHEIIKTIEQFSSPLHGDRSESGIIIWRSSEGSVARAMQELFAKRSA